MIACLDADYRDDAVVTACAGIHDWADALPAVERVVRSGPPAPYVPGAFYLREMPGLLAILEAVAGVALVVIDGYVWLGAERPGLGARLHDAVKLPVVGVAKTPFRDHSTPVLSGRGSAEGGTRDDRAIEITRGTSSRPLYVTAAGIDPSEAAACVARMHGPHRLPTILKRADRLAREG